jgi:heterotetrameric sarcosine oxidase gamma subunit
VTTAERTAVPRRSALEGVAAVGSSALTAIALEEVGPFDEWVIRGPGAVPVATSLAGGSLAIGRRSTAEVAGQTLDVWPLAEDEVVVTTAADGPLRDRIDALEKDDVSVVELTGGRTTLRLSGSSAGVLMTDLCAVDTSPAAVADDTIVQAPLVGVRAQIVRADGAYTLVVARDVARYVWESIVSLAPGASA